MRRRLAGGARRNNPGRAAVLRLQCSNADAEQADRPRKVNALQTLSGRASQCLRLLHRRGQGRVACHGAEVVEAQLDADRAPCVALALEVGGQPLAQHREDATERGAVAHRMQVALERRLAADRDGLAVRHDGPVVDTACRVGEPGAVAATEMLDEPAALARGEVADRTHVQRLEPRGRLRPDAVDAPRRQRPYARRNVGRGQHRQPVGLVELRGDLREQLVRRHADRAGQPGGATHAVLDLLRDGADAAQPVVADRVVDTGHRAQVDVDLVDAAVLDQRRHLHDRRLEQPRVAAVLVEIHRQQHRVGRALRGLHQPHARVHAEVARRVGGGRDHAAALVVAKRRERARAVGVDHRLVAPPAADHHRQPAQLGIAQQLDRCIERVHVEVGDPARCGGHGAIVASWRAPRRRIARRDRCTPGNATLHRRG
jgi:hypothetical protein